MAKAEDQRRPEVDREMRPAVSNGCPDGAIKSHYAVDGKRQCVSGSLIRCLILDLAVFSAQCAKANSVEHRKSQSPKAAAPTSLSSHFLDPYRVGIWFLRSTQ